MNNNHQRLKVLVFGAGRRVQNNFLPVLHVLSSQFEVIGIHSRTPASAQVVADRWGMPAVADLSAVDMGTVDVVAVSIPTGQNPVVLRKLLPYASRIRVVIDTPVAWNLSQLRDAAYLLPKFSSVTVTEDYMNFPTFALVREAVRLGYIGKLRTLTLNNTGYLYHGLALIRSFSNFSKAHSMNRHRLGQLGNVVGYRFGEGFQASVIGPYRSHTTGGLTLEGSDGVISEFPIDHKLGGNQKRNAFVLRLMREGGQLTGCAIEGNGCLLESKPEALSAMQSLPFDDKSDLNLLRGCGLHSIFMSLLSPDGLNERYGFQNALYDSYASRLADRGLMPVDPFTWIGSDVVSTSRGALRLMARIS